MSNGIIEHYQPDVNRVFLTEDLDVLTEEEGDGEWVWQCDDCCSTHDTEEEAEECCAAWICTICGASHVGDMSWSSAMYSATMCCAYECDECGRYSWSHDEHECSVTENQSDAPPWVRRGVHVDASGVTASNWSEVWDVNPEDHNVVQAAADFYLLEAMIAGLVGTTDGKGVVLRDIIEHPSMQVMRNEASRALDALVQVWDPILRSYTHMACGGELRHHQAVGGNVLNHSRDRAWTGWKLVYEAIGPQALLDAAELFYEFGGGTFGGTPWANACEFLYARETGKISSAMFLDRIFNHQHNGGNFLNKVHWYGDKKRDARGDKLMSLSDMTYHLLPAHGTSPEPEYPTLLAYASREVRQLFADTWEVAGCAAIHLGHGVEFRPARPTKGMTNQQRSRKEYNQAQLEAAEYANMPQSEKLIKKINQYDFSAKHYQMCAKDEQRMNYITIALKLMAGWAAYDWSPEYYYTDLTAAYQAHILVLNQQYIDAVNDEENMKAALNAKLAKMYAEDQLLQALLEDECAIQKQMEALNKW